MAPYKKLTQKKLRLEHSLVVLKKRGYPATNPPDEDCANPFYYLIAYVSKGRASALSDLIVMRGHRMGSEAHRFIRKVGQLSAASAQRVTT